MKKLKKLREEKPYRLFQVVGLPISLLLSYFLPEFFDQLLIQIVLSALIFAGSNILFYYVLVPRANRKENSNKRIIWTSVAAATIIYIFSFSMMLVGFLLHLITEKSKTPTIVSVLKQIDWVSIEFFAPALLIWLILIDLMICLFLRASFRKIYDQFKHYIHIIFIFIWLILLIAFFAPYMILNTFIALISVFSLITNIYYTARRKTKLDRDRDEDDGK